MNQQTAIQILVNGIVAAQKRGVYTLEESSLLFQAVSAFVKRPEDNPLQTPEQNVPNPLNSQEMHNDPNKVYEGDLRAPEQTPVLKFK